MLYDVTRALLPLLHSMRACNVDEVLSPALARLVQSLRILAFNTATVILLYDSVGMKLLLMLHTEHSSIHCRKVDQQRRQCNWRL